MAYTPLIPTDPTQQLDQQQSLDPSSLDLTSSPYTAPTLSGASGTYYPWMGSYNPTIGLPAGAKAPATTAAAAPVPTVAPASQSPSLVGQLFGPTAYTAGAQYGLTKLLPRLGVDFNGYNPASLGNLAEGAGATAGAGALALALNHALGGTQYQSTPKSALLGGVQGAGTGAALSPLLSAAIPNLENPLGWALLAGAGAGAVAGAGGAHLPAALSGNNFGLTANNSNIGKDQAQSDKDAGTLPQATSDLGKYIDYEISQRNMGHILTGSDLDQFKQQFSDALSHAYNGELMDPSTGKYTKPKGGVDKLSAVVALNGQVDKQLQAVSDQYHQQVLQQVIAQREPGIIGQMFQPLANQMIQEQFAAANALRPIAEQIQAGKGSGGKKAGPDTQSIALSMIPQMVQGAVNQANAYKYQAENAPALAAYQQQQAQSNAIASALRAREISNYVNQTVPSTSSSSGTSLTDLIANAVGEQNTANTLQGYASP